MRILVISDIHANLEALEASLAAAPSFDKVVNLGEKQFGFELLGGPQAATVQFSR